jgi:hypothetical protein
MLDTEAKVDQFLALLKTEIMSAKMVEGERGPYVTAINKQSEVHCDMVNNSLSVNGVVFKEITVHIAKEPLSACRISADKERYTIVTGKITDMDTVAFYDLGTGTMEQSVKPIPGWAETL